MQGLFPEETQSEHSLRGRPRPEETIRRDERVLEILRVGAMSRNRIRDKLNTGLAFFSESLLNSSLENTSVLVFSEGTNALAKLWKDNQGAIPLINPIDLSGTSLAFYAEVGKYRIKTKSAVFLINVGDPVSPSQVWLSLDRLRRLGKVKKCAGAGEYIWTQAVDKPCP